MKPLSKTLAFSLLTAAALAAQPASACKLASTHPWNANEAELVKTTETIAVAQVEDSKGFTSKAKDGTTSGAKSFFFKTVRALKGSPPKEFTLEGSWPFNREFRVHKSVTPPLFRITEPVGKSDGTIQIGADCTPETSGFTKGGTYLVFMKAMNPKGYMPIKASGDAWEKRVAELISKK